MPLNNNYWSEKKFIIYVIALKFAPQCQKWISLDQVIDSCKYWVAFGMKYQYLKRLNCIMK